MKRSCVFKNLCARATFLWASACLIQPLAAFAQEDADKPDSTPTISQSGEKPSDSNESMSTETTKKVIRTKNKSWVEEYGTSLILSADLGLLSGFPSTKLRDYGPKSGLAIEGKALGSMLLDKYIIDAGLGWYFYNVSGIEPVRNSAGDILVIGDDTAITDTVALKMSGTVIEIAPSYRIKPSVFSGPVIQLRYPSDLGYDSFVANKSLGIIVGAQGGYQIFDEDLNTRFVGRVMTSLNDKNWLGLYFMVGAQIGLPFSQTEELTIKESTVKTKEKRIVEYKKQEFKFKVTRDIIKLVLDNLVVFYDDPGYPTLLTESQSFLIDLAQSLSDSGKDWGLLRIDSVSKDHAQVIRDALVSAGIEEKKVKVGGVIAGQKGTNPPVEFSFTGVRDQTKLMTAVRQAMKAISVPETCQDGVCK